MKKFPVAILLVVSSSVIYMVSIIVFDIYMVSIMVNVSIIINVSIDSL